MSNDTETRLQSIRSQNQQSVLRRAQAEAKLDEVKSRQTQILQSLRELGFSDVAEARQEIQRLDAEVETVLAEIESKVSGQ